MSLDLPTDMPPDLWHKLPMPVIYVVGIGIVVSLIVIKLGEVIAASETIAQACGPPGRWWRKRIKNRSDKARSDRLSEMREAFGTPDLRVLKQRISTLEQMVHKLENEIRTTMDSREMDSAYLREDAEWHMRVGVLAAEHSFKLPKHRSYTQFCREWRIARAQLRRKPNDNEAGNQ